jgi:DNA-binding MarR family transcriptional regulator
LRGVPVRAEQQAPIEQSASPEDRLASDERSVLVAYRNGAKTGNAIAAETDLSSTRVNQILNKLSRLELIDWQPRKA